MEFTELSLARGRQYGKSSSEDEANNFPMKRKWRAEAMPNTVDLQLQHPLPSDWEQCLDLQTGRMYYVNRKTLKKSWKGPQEDDHDQHKLDLELNMSTGCSTNNTSTSNMIQKMDSSSSASMVALACSNCHLLVILSRSSPSCPNCKYVHSLAYPNHY